MCYGIIGYIKAKKHLNTIVDRISVAKNKLLVDVNGTMGENPGNDLLRRAFEGLIENYFGKL